jgi:magnesium transporter
VVLGVIGIVAFGSINEGLVNNMDLNLLISLWSRAGWLSYFVLMGVLPVSVLYIGASHLESILFSRQDLVDDPITPKPTTSRNGDSSGIWATTKAKWEHWMHWTRDKIEGWSIDKSDKTLAWTLGICWACCGGALAGGTLVFAKATSVPSSHCDPYIEILTTPQSQTRLWFFEPPKYWKPG